MSNIYYIRLKNGDQIVSKAETSNNKIIMDHPLEIHMFSNLQFGRPSVNLLEWITQPFVDTQIFELPLNEILIAVPASKELNDFYENTIRRIIVYRENKKSITDESDLMTESQEKEQTSRNSKKHLH